MAATPKGYQGFITRRNEPAPKSSDGQPGHGSRPDEAFGLDLTGLESVDVESEVMSVDPVDYSDVDRIPLHQGKVTANKVVVNNEQPWHRLAAGMLATGLRQGEVAKILGKSQQMIRILYSQDWFQKMLLEHLAKNMQLTSARNILTDGAAQAAMTMVKFAGGVGCTPSVALSAADKILARVLGVAGREKPETDENLEELNLELSEIDSQIAELELAQTRI